MVGIERNKDPELPKKQRNTSWFVLLDDRKHGRAGKFPVFYDTDTGDYLEPPEGFLDSTFETLKEWYAIHPADDPRGDGYQAHEGVGTTPLSKENGDKSVSDLQEEDTPTADDAFLEAQEKVEREFLDKQSETGGISTNPLEGEDISSDEPPF